MVEVGCVLMRREHRYEEIRDLYVQRLALVWTEDSTKEQIRAAVETKIKQFVKGELEHAAEMLSELWEVANNGVKARVQPPRPLYFGPVSRGLDERCVGDWFSTRVGFWNWALRRSIREGFFFDGKYWARHSKVGALKPIYLSSAVTAGVTLESDKRESRFHRYTNP